MEISIRELKANPAKAITQVRLGQRVLITSHRKVVAELVMPRVDPVAAERAEDEAAMARLLASGLVARPATQPFKLPELLKLSPSPDGKTMSDLVIEGRGPG